MLISAPSCTHWPVPKFHSQYCIVPLAEAFPTTCTSMLVMSAAHGFSSTSNLHCTALMFPARPASVNAAASTADTLL